MQISVDISKHILIIRNILAKLLRKALEQSSITYKFRSFKMKKQLLIAAVAATMTSVAIADISISGGAKVNYTNTDSSVNTSDSNTINHDVDFTIKGKNGGTTVSATFATTGKTGSAASVSTSTTVTDATVNAASIDNGTAATTTTTTTNTGTNAGLVTENVFLTTKIGDFNIKTGSYAGGDSNLGNGTRSDGKIAIDTTVAGIKLTFEDSDAAGNGSSIAMAGSMNGVSVSHKVANTSTDSKISGTFGGVTAQYRSIDADAANADKTSLAISTEINGITLAYAAADVDGAGQTTSDGFFGTLADLNEAEGFSMKTGIAGNTLLVKSYDVKTASTNGDDSYMKIIVTRPLANGTTFEATYTDVDMATGADKEVLDLELAVKF
jgi:hypothetical protein